MEGHMLPAGFTSRVPTLDDIDAVVHVENQRSLRDVGTADNTVDRLRMFWEEPDRNLQTDNLVVLDPGGRIVAAVDYSDYEPYTVSDFTFAVLPEHENQGIEEFLLDWVAQRAELTVPKVSSGTRAVVETSVWATNDDVQQRLRGAGYSQCRVYHRMQIDMVEAPPAPEWPGGISVRTFQPDEVDAVHAAWEDAQSDEWGHSSLSDEEFRYYFVEREANFDPTLWFLAIDDATGEIIGYTLCRWERPGEPEVGHVRYVAVRRPYRRRGIAHALLLHTFGEFYRRGKRKVSLGVDSTSRTGADRLYIRAGMKPIQSSIIFERVIREARG
jgi:mycothiol synthase